MRHGLRLCAVLREDWCCATARRVLLFWGFGLLYLLAGCGRETAPAAAASALLSMTALTFPATTVGTASATSAVTLTNTGGQTLAMTSYVLSDTKNFSLTTTCGSSLAAGASCAFSVRFIPQSATTIDATLTVTDNSGGESGTQQLLTITGTGTPVPVPQAVLSPTSLSFPQTILHVPAPAQMVTLSNPGTATLQISNAVLSDTSDFTMTSSCGAALPAGASCTFSIVFQPQALGTISATFTVTDNSGGLSGMQQTVALSGTGVPIPVSKAVLSLAGLSFAPTVLNTSATAQTIMLGNAGTAPLTIDGLVLGDIVEYSVSNTCGATLPVGASCLLTVNFHPQSVGVLPSTLTLTDNSGVASGTVQQVIALNGTGLPVPVPQAVLTPVAVSFAATNVGAISAAEVYTLANTGTASLTIGGVDLSDAGDFSLTNNCGSTLPPSGSCSFAVVFQPQKAGVLSGTITVTDNSSGNNGAQQVISLQGTGVALPAPQALLTPSVVVFADTMVTTSAAAQAIRLQNAGNAPLTLTSAVLSDLQSFTLSSTCPGTLTVNASCTFLIGFQPQSVTALHAMLTLTDNSGASSGTAQQSIAITGNGIAFSGPRGVVTPSALTFPQTVTNSSAPPQMVTLTNTGTKPLTVSGVTVSGTNAAAFTLANDSCGGALLAGASCTVTVIYHPVLANAADHATLVFADDALGQSGSTQTVALTGSALAEIDSVANFGDSITCGFYAQPHDGTGYVYSLEGYAGLFDTFLGVPAQNICRQGDTAADLSRLWVPFNSTPTGTDHQLYTLMIGTNDAYRYGIGQSSLTTYAQEVGAALSWLAIPSSDKILANAVTQQTGNWITDVGFGMMSTDAGASLTFNVNQAVAGHNLYVVYHVWAQPYGQAGKATISVDGVPQATVDESQNSSVNIPTQNGTFDTFLLQNVPLGAVGQHTVSFSSAGPSGSAVGMLWAGVPQQDYRSVDGAPRVLAGLITNSPSGNQTYAADVYNLQLKQLNGSLQTDGLNVVIVPTDRVLDTDTDFVDLLHPNIAGHAKLAAAFESFR